MRLLALPLVLVPLFAAACTDNYHPEYHPVTVTSYEQHVAYPAGQAGPPPAPGATMNVPAPPRPPTPAPWSAWPSE